MSRKHCRYQCRYQYSSNYGMPNLYVFLILILIVLQWFRVGYPNVTPGGSNEVDLLSNGGLFIIVLFFLIACSCGLNAVTDKAQMHSHPGCRCH